MNKIQSLPGLLLLRAFLCKLLQAHHVIVRNNVFREWQSLPDWLLFSCLNRRAWIGRWWGCFVSLRNSSHNDVTKGSMWCLDQETLVIKFHVLKTKLSFGEGRVEANSLLQGSTPKVALTTTASAEIRADSFLVYHSFTSPHLPVHWARGREPSSVSFIRVSSSPDSLIKAISGNSESSLSQPPLR